MQAATSAGGGGGGTARHCCNVYPVETENINYENNLRYIIVLIFSGIYCGHKRPFVPDRCPAAPGPRRKLSWLHAVRFVAALIETRRLSQ